MWQTLKRSKIVKGFGFIVYIYKLCIIVIIKDFLISLEGMYNSFGNNNNNN